MRTQNHSEKLESYVLSVIDGTRRSKLSRLLRIFLWLLSNIYAGVIQIRIWLYFHGIIRPHTLGCQVISVGNLTVGGTGKTPIVEVFARALQNQGRKIAILSRGYRSAKPPLRERIAQRFSKREKNPPRVVSDGQSLLLDSTTGGDEPYMLASNLPRVSVLVDKDRVNSGSYAIRHLNCDTLILDDGFQYLSLHHRLDIVLVDSKNPFGYNHILPRGLLREPMRNIKRAGFIFITKCGPNGAPDLKKQLRKLNPTAEICECQHSSKYLQDVYTGEQCELKKLQDMKVAAISGIAAPTGFESALSNLGANIIYRERHADHHRYSQQEIINMINSSVARGVDAILTTEKDAVRFPLIERRDLPIYYLRVEIEMLSGKNAFRDWIRRICFQ